MTNTIIRELKKLANPIKVKVFLKFFKTGKGQYGEGDKFLGLTVPQVRQIAKQFAAQTTLDDIHKLLQNSYHEVRLLALIIMTYQYHKLEENAKYTYYRFYLDHSHRINNWDLVDLSAPKIAGAWLLKNKADRVILDQLVKSSNLWRRRIAVLTTYPMIKAGEFAEILDLAQKLLTDKQDLMHKAVGWMLREAGKKDLGVLVRFLDQNATQMPRTMLRYAIEKLPEKTRRMYLVKKS